MSNNVKDIVRTLSSSDPRKIYNTLLRVPSEVIKVSEDLKYFKENRGLNYVMQFLDEPNVKILNISLGILGECCLNEDCCNEIMAENILRRIIPIMKNKSQDTILYRCCKLIGNLARQEKFCSTLISDNVCELINSAMNGVASESTQFVVLRCARYLWMGANAKEKKIIAGTLILPSVKYLESNNPDILKSVFKLLLCVLKSRSDINLKNLITGEVLGKIVSKTSDYPSLTLKIFYYLSEIRFLHFLMAKAGVVEVIFSRIRHLNSTEFESENEEYMELVLRSLHHLCSDAKCRERISCIPDAFDRLLNITESSSYFKFKKYSVLILCSYMYDESSLKRLAAQHVVVAITNYLKIVVYNQGTSHGKEDFKNEINTSSCSPSPSGRSSPPSDSETSFSLSASPYSERYVLSPHTSIDSVYSPVCSPALDDTEEDDAEDVEKSSDELSSIAESPLILQENDFVKVLTEEKIFALLKQLICLAPNHDLCTERTWQTLLDYLTLVRRSSNHVTSILNAIAGNNFYFFELLKSQFVWKVHKKLCRPVHVDCNYCQEMSKYGDEILIRYQNVAESSYGHSILRNEITKKSNSENCIIVALTIPLIVKDVTKLEEFLLRYRALPLIMESLNEEADTRRTSFHEKVACLHYLANDVYLENPRKPSTLCKKCDVGSLTKEGTITFLLDDGSTVTANKRIICEKSEFFEAMFRCGFKEAKESVVRLSNITSDCLTALFRLLYSYCDCIIPKNVLTLLELIVQSDRFLIPSLSQKLLDITMNCILDYKNCHLIYEWAIENNKFLSTSNDWPVCQDVLKYALVENLTFKERTYSMRMLLRSRYKAQVLQDISQIIECQLKCKSIKTKSSMKYIRENAEKRRKIG